jgi:hypothetical protein
MRLPNAGFALSKASAYPSSSSSAKPHCVEQSLNSLSIIILNACTKAKEISCSSLLLCRYYHDLPAASNVMNASVNYSSFINAPREFFDDSRIDIFESKGREGV